MLTKNFYSYIRAAFSGSDTSATFTKTDGTTSSVPTSANYPPFKVMNKWAKSITGTGVSFGTGTTPATASDYVLESILDDNKINVSTPSSIRHASSSLFSIPSAISTWCISRQ